MLAQDEKKIIDHAHIGGIVSDNFHCCNLIISIEYHGDGTIGSNQHYIITTPISKYFLKTICNADALFQGGASFRIKTVSEAINQLKNKGLNLEHIIQNKDGEFITNIDGVIYRLYEFIKGRSFNNTESDIKQAARSMSNFHEKAHKLLDKNIHFNLKKIRTPYPLDQSIKNIAEIKQSIDILSSIPSVHKNTFKLLSNEFEFIEKGVSRVINLTDKEADCHFIHLDFHPDNVIYDANGVANIIDLDNAMLGNLNKCIAFSILRFSLYNQPSNPYKNIINVSKIWIKSQEYEKSLQFSDLVDWMLYVELEKILRIVGRYIETGKYSKFLININKTHFPNLRLLLNGE